MWRHTKGVSSRVRAFSPGSFALLPSAFIGGNNLLSASGQSARLFRRHNSQGRCNDRLSRSHTRKAHSNEPYACGKQVLKRYRFRNKRTFGIVKCPRFALVRLPTTSCRLQGRLKAEGKSAKLPGEYARVYARALTSFRNESGDHVCTSTTFFLSLRPKRQT